MKQPNTKIKHSRNLRLIGKLLESISLTTKHENMKPTQEPIAMRSNRGVPAQEGQVPNFSAVFIGEIGTLL